MGKLANEARRGDSMKQASTARVSGGAPKLQAGMARGRGGVVGLDPAAGAVRSMPSARQDDRPGKTQGWRS